MLRPRAWTDAIRMARALRNYPTYCPPFLGVPSALSREEGQANYEYFLRTKEERLSELQAFLLRFAIRASCDDAGLRSVDQWLHQYGGHLAPKSTLHTYLAFANLIPRWEGEFKGLNVVWDIGIFAGEVCRRLEPSCDWYLCEGIGRMRKEDPANLRPCLRIPARPGYWDIFTTMLSIGLAKRELIVIGRQPCESFLDYAPDALAKRIQFRLVPSN